jgi:threonine dehydratase
MMEKTGAFFVPPGNHRNVFLGAGTTMYEFQQQVSTQYSSTLDAVIVPIGMGGLISGCSLACSGSGTRVFGAEPTLASQCALRLEKGGKVYLATASSTIADGVRVGVADLTFAVINEHVEEVFTVTDEQIAKAMRILIERLKLVIEPTAAVAVAVLLFQNEFKKHLEGVKNIGIILEGGNVDTSKVESMMPWLN